MNKRVYDEDSDKELTKKFKDTEWEEYVDIHPTVYDFVNPTRQDCRLCGEPLQDHHYYTMEHCWNVTYTASVLRCDRKIMRNYYAKLKIFENPGRYYRLFLTGTIHDVYELNEGRKTQ